MSLASLALHKRYVWFAASPQELINPSNVKHVKDGNISVTDFGNYRCRAFDRKDRTTKRTSVAGQIGNSMNTNVAGAALLWAMLYVVRAKDVSLLDVLRGA